MKKVWLGIFLLLTVSIQGFSQEICGNGIDDDGDGFIDCFDSDCAGSETCEGFYIGNDVVCQAEPSDLPEFELKAGSQSDNRITDTWGRINIGDLDRDGTPEITSVNTSDGKLYILNGADLSVKYSASPNGNIQKDDHCIANINDDDCGEIFIVTYRNNHYYINSYDCQANLLWSTRAGVQPNDLGIADFNQDGAPEIYYRDEILDAATGRILVEHEDNRDDDEYDAGPVAVDILDDYDGLELVTGGYIYQVKIVAGQTNGGSLTKRKSMPSTSSGNISYYPDNGGVSATSVADYNQDGYLDVIASGACNSQNGHVGIFFWDVENNKSTVYQTEYQWNRGTGRVNIADIDGDGSLNCTFVSGPYLYALNADMSLKWINESIKEVTSGVTGTSVFDFNNDGAVETVYRDEKYLYIIDGSTGAFYTQVRCNSRTYNEYPIVADLDGDGATEICVVCNTDDSIDIDGSTSDSYTKPYDGQIRVYESNLEPWVPARKIWNQHGYFNVNVNDDLTIPQVQQQSHLVFSTTPCILGGSGDSNRPLNTFLNQSPFLDSDGCSTYASPDLQFASANSTITVNPPTCPDTDFTVSFSIENVGDNSLSGNLPVTFYSGDPTAAGAVKLNTAYITISNLAVDATFTTDEITVSGTGSSFTLYVVLNDAGTTVPTPIELPNSDFYECDYDNNIQSAEIEPSPFELTAEVLSNNISCTNGTGIANGAAQAYKLEDGVEVVADYSFYWFNSATAGDEASADYEGSVYSSLESGTYSVYAVHKSLDCGSDTTQVTIDTEEKDMNIDIIIDHAYTNCLIPDGVLHVEVYDESGDVEPYVNYTYEWYEGNNAAGGLDILSTSYTLTNLEGITYTVMVTEIATGCEAPDSETVPDETEKPEIESIDITDAKCDPADTGSAKVNMDGGTTGFTIDWYDGTTVKPSADYTGDTYSAIEAGDYVVQVTNDATGCTSNAQLVEIGSENEPVIVTTILSQLTACDSPNGSISVTADGTTTGYTFTWYTGNNTASANVITTGATITGLADGTYTVKAVNDNTKCSATALVTIDDEIENPTVTTTTVDQTTCDPANGSATGEATGGSGTYTYYWFDGSVASPDPASADFEGSSYTGLEAGEYSIIAVDASTQCTSDVEVVEIADNTPTWTVSTTMTPQSSCDTSNPNGSIAADVGGNTTDYTFAWYAGSSATGTVLSTDATITGLAYGSYTVEAKETSTGSGCTNTALVTVTNDPATPEITDSDIIDNTTCSGATATGSITIEIDGGADPADYTIEWFEGSGTSGTAVTTTSGVNNETAEQLVATQYTVLITTAYSCTASKTFTVGETIPTITVETADVTVTGDENCIAPGTGTATVTEVTVDGTGTGSTTGYTFAWYNSDAVTLITGAGDGSTVGTLENGTYYVQAIQDATACTSALTAFTIDDDSTVPAVNETIVNNSNCSSGGSVTPTGKITLDINSGADLSDFTITWFEGTSSSGSALGTTIGSVAGTDGQVAQELDNSMKYTVLVTDNASPGLGCETEETYTITNDPADITIELAGITLGDDTDCDGEQGFATVTEVIVDGTGVAVDDYEFAWYESDGVTLITGAGTAATADELPAGDYQVQAINTITKCTSSLTAFTIDDTSTPPTIAGTITNNANCSGATPTGSITVNINSGEDLSNFTIAWFEGTSVTGNPLGTTVGSVSGTNNETAGALSKGSYTVQVTDNTTPGNGCVATKTFEVEEVTPTLSIETKIDITDNTNCDPVNGSATVTAVVVDAVDDVVANYTFAWYSSDGTTAITDAGTDATIDTDLGGGNYFVQAVNKGSNCKTDITPFTIADNQVAPTITEADNTDNTNCGTTKNGSITIDINSGDDPADYIIEWFEGSGTGTPLGTTIGTTGGTNGEIASALKKGTYTVRVTGNGTANVGCEATAEFTIDDDLSYPSPAGDVTNNTACSSDKYNGVIEADVSGATAGYTFSIYKTPGTPLNDATTTYLAENLAPGTTYTVKATDNSTQCSGTITVTVGDDSVLPEILSTSSTDVTSCTTPNGTAFVVSVSIGDLSDYDFKWYNGKVIKTTVDYAETGSTLSDIGVGNYTVTGTNTKLGCDITEPKTIAVDLDTDSEITITSLGSPEQIQPSVCNDGLGQLAAKATTINNQTSSDGGFTFTWYIGDANTGFTDLDAPHGQNFDPNSNRISNSASGQAINSGLYTVIALDNNTGCQDSLSINLPYSEEAALLSVLTYPQTDCLIPDGGFDATVTPGSGTLTLFPTLDQSWYKLEVYQDGDLKATINGTSGVAITEPFEVTGLDFGSYTILAKEIESLFTHDCYSAPSYVDVEDQRDYPEVTVADSQVNKNCDGALAGDGYIELSVNGTPTPASGYDYEWHVGQTLDDDAPTSPIDDSEGHTIKNLTAGWYTVNVTDENNHCSTEKSVNIGAVPYNVEIITLDLDNQTDCTPNGDASVTAIEIDDVSTALSEFDYTWLESDATTTIDGSGNTETVGTTTPSLSADTYVVQVTHQVSQCTAFKEFTIEDDSDTPSVSASFTANTICDDDGTVTPNGALTVLVDNTTITAGYSVEWFYDEALSEPVTATSSELISGSFNEMLSQLSGDTKYTVRVTDTSTPGKDCQTVMSFTTTEDLPVVVIEDLDLTKQIDCQESAGAEVIELSVDGTTVPTANYSEFTFTWINSTTNATLLGPSTDAAITDLLAGSYQVQARQTASNCATSKSFTLIEDFTKPSISHGLTANTHCDGITPDGAIEITQIASAAPSTDYTISWYYGSDTSTPVSITSPDPGVLSGTINELFSALPAADYTVVITDNVSPNKGCATTETYTLTNDRPDVVIADQDIIHQIDCGESGSITITDVTLDGTSTDVDNDYTYTWFNASTGASITDTDVTIENLLEGTYQVRALHKDTNCKSNVVSYDIDDATTDITLTADITDNTHCDDIAPDGVISITKISSDADYTAYTEFSLAWFYGKGTTDPYPSVSQTYGSVAGTNNETFEELLKGNYTITVVDNASPNKGCSTEVYYAVDNNRPTLAITGTTIIDKLNCDVGGSAEVTEITLTTDGIPAASSTLTGYEFTWYNSNGSEYLAQSATTLIDDVAVGSYQVEAKHLATNCVSSAAIPFTITDKTEDPIVDYASLIDNSFCAGASPTGSIEITVDGGTPVLGTDYTVTWYEMVSGSPVLISGETDYILSDIDEGTYQAVVEDINPNNRGCIGESNFSIFDDPDIVVIATTEVTPQYSCDPVDGAAEVLTILYNNVSESAASGYTYTWYESDETTTITTSTTSTLEDIAAGTYYVEALNTTSNCATDKVALTIDDERIYPGIEIARNHANVACNTNYTGELTATVLEGTTHGITSGYTFEWFNTGNTSLATTNVLSDVQDGTYKVTVTDTDGEGIGCSNTASKDVLLDTIVVNGITSTTPQTVCDPLDGEASVTSTTVLLEGTSTSYDMTDVAQAGLFSFEWYDPSDAAGGVKATTATYASLAAGTYNVKVTNLEYECSGLTSAIVEDETEAPNIVLVDSSNPTMCVEDVIEGQLTVAPDGDASLVDDYTYAWYAGSTVNTGSEIGTENTYSGVRYDDAALTYTVELTNIASQCKASDTYPLEIQKLTIVTIASALPLTHCVDADGELSARVQDSDDPDAYNWEWYEGEGITGTLISSEQNPTGLGIGTYTVQAIHPDASLGCVTIPGTITIDDGRIYPSVEVTEISPLTYCDEDNPNGAAKATVDGTIIGYQFDWFENTSPASAADLGVYTGSVNTSLKAITYFVRATNLTSECANVADITIDFDPVSVASPVAETLPRTNCVTPNGTAYVVESSNQKTYSWYDGNSVSNTPDNTEVYYYDIDAGNYTVTATDQVTLCVSDPVTVTVLEEYVYPEFELTYKLPECDYTNGRVDLVTQNSADIQSIVWDIDGYTYQGPAVTNIPAGNGYIVTATTTLDCSTAKTFDLPADIVVYNAVSNNGDGQNDYFDIGCIGNYDDNTVRIYNRAGTLVYEAQHYDNEDTAFRGVSNRGVSVLGTDLPDGTYFYIIDKGNGTKPRTGYLELIK